MKNSQLNRVLNLVRLTGDRVVVMDPETDDVVVMMQLPEYEDLLEQKQTKSDRYFSDDFTDELENTDEEKPWKNSFNLVEEDEEMEQDFGEDFLEEGGSDLPFTPTDWKNSSPWEEETKPAKQKSYNSIVSKKEPASNNELSFEDFDWEKEPNLSFTEEPLNDLPEEEEERFYIEPIE